MTEDVITTHHLKDDMNCMWRADNTYERKRIMTYWHAIARLGWDAWGPNVDIYIYDRHDNRFNLERRGKP